MDVVKMDTITIECSLNVYEYFVKDLRSSDKIILNQRLREIYLFPSEVYGENYINVHFRRTESFKNDKIKIEKAFKSYLLIVSGSFKFI